MKKLSALFTACSLSALLFSTALYATSAQAAEQQVSQKVGKPLQEAITAAQKKQWEEALVKINEAKAVPDKTAFEEFKINEASGWVLSNLKRWNEAAAAFERTLDSGFLTADQAEQHTKAIIQFYMQVKQNAKLMEYLPRWLKSHPNDAEMIYTLAIVQLQSGQNKQARDTLEGLISTAEKAGQRPKEEWLKIVYAINYKLADNKLDKPTLAVVEKLLRYYPEPAYWLALLGGLRDQLTSDNARFQLYRLMESVGALKAADDYIELAQYANHFGFSAEAVSVMNSGFAAKVLGEGDAKERQTRLLGSMKKSTETDQAALPALDKKAREAADGQEDVTLGENYIGYGQYSQAIEALERGLKKGGVKNIEQAQMALGIAYFDNKQKEQARAAFKQIPASSELGRIASLWILHASN